MQSRVEIGALIVAAVLVSGVVWVPAVCLIRRLWRWWRQRRVEVELSLLDVIGRR